MGRRGTIILPSRCCAGSTQSPASIVGRLSVRPGDDRKCPCGQQWSELRRDDRIVAECASHPPPRNKFSLFPWQAMAAMAALLHSCFDHQRMLMRRMQGRRSLSQIGPTSRTRDSVWFLYPCRDFDAVPKLSKSIPDPLGIFEPAHFLHLEECFNQSKENVRAEYCSDALLLLRCGRP